jgi:hypothetical protein
MPYGRASNTHHHDIEVFFNKKFARKRYLHSTESWRRLWIKTFTDLEGAEFAEKHVVVDVDWESLDISVGNGQVVGMDIMHWSVQIV